MKVGYARVSTLDQADNTNALEQQVARLKAAGATEIVLDVESGRKTDRDILDALLQRVKKREVTELIITRLDRLSRSLPHMRQVLDVLKENKVNLKALDDSIDWDTPGGKFHINLLGSLAEMESDRLSERINHGKEFFRKQGKVSHPPLGYRKKDEYHFELDKTPWLCSLSGKKEISKYDIGRHLIAAYIETRALTKTVKTINDYYGTAIFNRSALRRWLLSPVLEGAIAYFPKSDNPIIIPEKHPPIITPEEKAEVLQILRINKARRGFGGRAKAIYPLSGLIKCSQCGRGCVVSSGGSATEIVNGKKKRIVLRYYRCHLSRESNCSNNTHIRSDIIEAKVIEALTNKYQELAELAIAPDDDFFESPEIKILQEQYNQLTSIPGNNSAIAQAKKDIELQIKQLKTNNKKDIYSKQRELQVLHSVFQDPEFFKALDDKEKRRVYHTLVKQITLRPDTGENRSRDRRSRLIEVELVL